MKLRPVTKNDREFLKQCVARFGETSDIERIYMMASECVYKTFVIVEDDGKAIGYLGATLCEDDEAWLEGAAPKAVNPFLVKRALRAFIDYLFRHCGQNRAVARVNVENPAAEMLLRAAGLTKEGLLKEGHKTPDGNYINVVQLSVCKRDLLNCKPVDIMLSARKKRHYGPAKTKKAT